jgi:biotin operon repressor
MEQVQSLQQFFQAVGQVERLQVMGRLAERPYRIAELAEQLGLRETAVLSHLDKLKSTGLITDQNGAVYALDKKALADLNRVIFSRRRENENGRETRQQRVFRHYLDGERLRGLPENQDELMVILRWLAEQFEPDARYTEKEVNETLKRHYDDYATLRRYLVDNRLMQRASGCYWLR